MADLEELQEYITSSNDALQITLTRPGSHRPVLEEPFNPQFTYPVFGEEEVIVGYSNLTLDLTFRANDMRPTLKISYDDARDFGEQKRMDIKELLSEFVSEQIYDEDSSDDGASSAQWQPPGKLQQSYSSDGRTFEIWVAPLSDSRAKELFRRFQILIPFYIEGGTLQSLDDPEWTMARWKLFLIYETTAFDGTAGTSPYTFVGFSTSYRLWVLPSFSVVQSEETTTTTKINESADAHSHNTWRPATPPWDAETYNFKDLDYDPISSPSRERISQFVILPPFQGQSHGSRLYNTMFEVFSSDPNVFEITVEDPNESFDDMRDWCDLPRLRKIADFSALSLPSTIPEEQFAKDAYIPIDSFVDQRFLTVLRQKSKITFRQFARLTEMQLLSGIPEGNRSKARITRKHKSLNEHDRRYFYWRLLVKERIYQKNLDQLAQLEIEERKEKVDEACDAVQEEYTRILQGAAKREKWAIDAGETSGKDKGLKRRRVLIEDEEDEDEDGTTEGKVGGKRPKV